MKLAQGHCFVIQIILINIIIQIHRIVRKNLLKLYTRFCESPPSPILLISYDCYWYYCDCKLLLLFLYTWGASPLHASYFYYDRKSAGSFLLPEPYIHAAFKPSNWFCIINYFVRATWHFSTRVFIFHCISVLLYIIKCMHVCIQGSKGVGSAARYE